MNLKPRRLRNCHLLRLIAAKSTKGVINVLHYGPNPPAGTFAAPIVPAWARSRQIQSARDGALRLGPFQPQFWWWGFMNYCRTKVLLGSIFFGTVRANWGEPRYRPSCHAGRGGPRFRFQASLAAATAGEGIRERPSPPAGLPLPVHAPEAEPQAFQKPARRGHPAFQTNLAA